MPPADAHAYLSSKPARRFNVAPIDNTDECVSMRRLRYLSFVRRFLRTPSLVSYMRSDRNKSQGRLLQQSIINIFHTHTVFSNHYSGVAGIKQMELLIRRLLKVELTCHYYFLAELFPES